MAKIPNSTGREKHLTLLRCVLQYSGLQIIAVGFLVAMSGGALGFLAEYIRDHISDPLVGQFTHLLYWIAIGIFLFGWIIGFIGLLLHWSSMLSSTSALTKSLFKDPGSEPPSDN